ncbi:MAG: hypothetical protein IMW96_05840 [Thermoanaerobacteraceae bacterium]|uniref:hypothetical protein n=1 Tax=Thermanaeromonas sp. C210 TaxID=2731925 RepID=UPI00155CC8FC|nr:hypothetical protein [Thermanaeromonas sp. C210]MBE3581143.1 hypothetical protein [Thermoanaerobacteraceae bacterium]GFN23246.1 hydrogensulfite reductase [Thermanaeromonas sp. C210]
MTEAGELPAGIMPDFRRELPPYLKEKAGSWVWHEEVGPGIIKHTARDGSELWSVRILLPPNGLLAAASLRKLAGFIKRYALTGRRTFRQGFELVGVDPSKLDILLKELAAAGFPVGGTGRTLHQIKCCTSFVHCQNAAVDAPSIAKVLGDYLYRYFTVSGLPAQLKVSISGCPNSCGGSVEADIGIVGVFADVPEVNDRELIAANEDIGLLVSWCPAGAIRPKRTPEGTSVTINKERCVLCTSCAQAAPRGIKMGPNRGAAILVGGRGGARPSLGQVVFPFVPAKPVDYGEICRRIRLILDFWIREGKPGERLATFVQRVGGDHFRNLLGVEEVSSLPGEKGRNHDFRPRHT